MDDLTVQLTASGATVAFDAIGGGDWPTDITAMELAAKRRAKDTALRITTHKQVYIYGDWTAGRRVQSCLRHAWGIGGWLLTAFLQKIGFEAARSSREGRAEIKTYVREHLYEGSVSRRSAAARESGLQQASHRSEVSDQPEQRTPLSQHATSPFVPLVHVSPGTDALCPP